MPRLAESHIPTEEKLQLCSWQAIESPCCYLMSWYRKPAFLKST